MHSKRENPDRLATQGDRDLFVGVELTFYYPSFESPLQLAVYLPYGMARKLRSALYLSMLASTCVIIPANF
jgi:hypothetical protein